VREGYLSIAQEEGKRFHVVEGQHSIEEIHEHIWSLVQPHLQKHPEKSP
jgi:thymidylate kinase